MPRARRKETTEKAYRKLGFSPPKLTYKKDVEAAQAGDIDRDERLAKKPGETQEI